MHFSFITFCVYLPHALKHRSTQSKAAVRKETAEKTKNCKPSRFAQCIVHSFHALGSIFCVELSSMSVCSISSHKSVRVAQRSSVVMWSIRSVPLIVTLI